MKLDEISQRATRDVGGYLLTHYRNAQGALRAVDSVSALGALAGIFAQVQARGLLSTGGIPQTQNTLLEVKTTEGAAYYFGDAINRCMIEADPKIPSFWVIAAIAAKDPKVGEKIDVLEIAKHTAKAVGTPAFGIPRVDARYKLTEPPHQAVRTHGSHLLKHFGAIRVEPQNLVRIFGSVAQSFASFAAGEVKDVRVDAPMNRLDIVRLYMESAIPMSKLDLRVAGVAIEQP